MFIVKRFLEYVCQFPRKYYVNLLFPNKAMKSIFNYKPRQKLTTGGW